MNSIPRDCGVGLCLHCSTAELHEILLALGGAVRTGYVTPSLRGWNIGVASRTFASCREPLADALPVHAHMQRQREIYAGLAGFEREDIVYG
jgi:hypothetical protein